MNKSANENLHY